MKCTKILLKIPSFDGALLKDCSELETVFWRDKPTRQRCIPARMGSYSSIGALTNLRSLPTVTVLIIGLFQSQSLEASSVRRDKAEYAC